MIELLLAAVAHSGSILGTHQILPQPVVAMVWVQTCNGQWQDIYADSKMTLPEANPFIVSADGSYRYYSTSRYGQVTVVYDGKAIVTRTCKKEEK